MRQIRTALIGVIMLLSVCGFAVAGGGGEETSTQEGPTRIVIWSPEGTPEERVYFSGLVEQFNAEHPDIVVEEVVIPNAAYTEQLNAGVMTSDVGDILYFDGPNLYNYAWSGTIVPLDDYVSDEMLADFLPSIIEQGTYNGQLYALGQMDSAIAIWGNREYLDRAGVRIPEGVSDPWSREEFEDALARLAALPEVDYPLDMKFNYGVGEWFTYGLAPILWMFGGDLIDRTDFQTADGVLNGPEAVAAFEWLRGLVDNGYVNTTPAGDDDFYGKKTAALSYVGMWMWPPHHEGLGDDLVIMPIPRLGPGNPVTGIGSWCMGISSYCENPEAAWEFLEFVMSPEAIAQKADLTGGVPARNSAVPLSESYGPGGPLGILVQELQAGWGVARPQTPAYPVITNAFAEAVNNILVAGADIQSELDHAVERIDEDIADNNGYR